MSKAKRKQKKAQQEFSIEGDYREWLIKYIKYPIGEDATPEEFASPTHSAWYDYKALYDSDPSADPSQIKLGLYDYYPENEVGQTANYPFFSSKSYYSGKQHPLYNPKGVIGGDLRYEGKDTVVYQLSQSQVDNGWDLKHTFTHIRFLASYFRVLDPNGKEYKCDFDLPDIDFG